MDKQHFRIDRQYVRLNTRIKGRISQGSAPPHDMTVLNLSLGGLKLTCNHDTFTTLVPPDQRTPGQLSDVCVTVSFTLRSPGRRAMSIRADARLIHSERLAQDCYHIGVQFTDLGKTLINRLEAFIEAMRTAQQSKDGSASA